MASACTTDNIDSDSSTNERHGRSDVMNLILAELNAQYRIETFEREADARRLAALARATTAHAPAHGRPGRTAGLVRLILRGTAA
jgi:hypothetical protein